MKGISAIVNDIEKVVTAEALAETYGLNTDDVTNAIFQKLHGEGVTDVPALMKWSHDLLGRLGIWRILENLQLNFDKNEPTDSLLIKWFSCRGIGEHLQPKVRPDELTQDLTEMVQQAAATPATFDVFRLIEAPLTSLMRYTSLFYWRELRRNGLLTEPVDAQAGDTAIIGTLEGLSLSKLCTLLNCDAPLKARPYDPASQIKIILSSGAAGTGLSRLAEFTRSASAPSSPDQSLELAECLMTLLQEWHGDDPYTPKACAVAEIHQTSFNSRLTCYDEMGATVILNGVTASIAYGDDVLVRSGDEGEVWATRPQAVPRNAVWQMPETVSRKGTGERAIQTREAGKRLPPTRDRVFLCYSHANSAWMERLLVHLGPLRKDNLVDVWSDERIRPGDDWRAEIDAALATARFAVLLVSADFYNSVFIRDIELPSLLAASGVGGCKVIPLLVSASRFLSDPALSRFQAATREGRTLAAMTAEEAEQVLADLAAAIEDEISHLN